MDIIILTAAQTALARHALGLTQRRHSFRNRFFVGEGCDAYSAWEQMVALGAAIRIPRDKVQARRTGLQEFEMTLAGARSVLQQGEALDMEDFSEATLPEAV